MSSSENAWKGLIMNASSDIGQEICTGRVKPHHKRHQNKALTWPEPERV